MAASVASVCSAHAPFSWLWERCDAPPAAEPWSSYVIRVGLRTAQRRQFQGSKLRRRLKHCFVALAASPQTAMERDRSESRLARPRRNAPGVHWQHHGKDSESSDVGKSRLAVEFVFSAGESGCARLDLGLCQSELSVGACSRRLEQAQREQGQRVRFPPAVPHLCARPMDFCSKHACNHEG